MNALPLSVKNLSVEYPGGTKAVQNVSLDLQPGEILALLGPNGSGKSSFLNAVAGIIKTTSGSVSYGGQDLTGRPHIASESLSLMSDPLGLYPDLTCREYLDFFASTYRLSPEEKEKRIANAGEKLGLTPWFDKEAGTLSSGWQRRLALGRIHIADNPVLLLDEPAAGLDIVARTDLINVVKDYAKEGRSILITSHILTELEPLADRFVIINKGKWAPIDEKTTFFTRDQLKEKGADLTKLTLGVLGENPS